jgi:hypothetical protein
LICALHQAVAKELSLNKRSDLVFFFSLGVAAIPKHLWSFQPSLQRWLKLLLLQCFLVLKLRHHFLVMVKMALSLPMSGSPDLKLFVRSSYTSVGPTTKPGRLYVQPQHSL